MEMGNRVSRSTHLGIAGQGLFLQGAVFVPKLTIFETEDCFVRFNPFGKKDNHLYG